MREQAGGCGAVFWESNSVIKLQFYFVVETDIAPVNKWFVTR